MYLVTPRSLQCFLDPGFITCSRDNGMIMCVVRCCVTSDNPLQASTVSAGVSRDWLLGGLQLQRDDERNDAPTSVVVIILK